MRVQVSSARRAAKRWNKRDQICFQHDKCVCPFIILYHFYHYKSVNTATLLHELGHVMNYLAAGFGSQNSFAGDRYSDAASRSNTTLVEDNCVKNLKF
jgi:hypothetical protein